MASISNNLDGNYVTLRNVKSDDAEFILSLRCNEKKSKFLHKTENDVIKQQNYITNCLNVADQYYFISENKDGKRIGTIRIYDITDTTFTGGSWLMVDGSSPQEVIETEYLMKKYGFCVLNKPKCVFDVRKENKKVIRYHKMMGAKVVGETELDYLFECTKEDYMKNIKNFIDTLNYN